MYVVGILMGLWAIRGYTARKGIHLYLYGYAVTQFFLFFARDNVVVNFLGLNWGLKQVQWTSIVLFLLPVIYLVFRYSKPVPVGEVAATYGIPQPPEAAEQGKEGRVVGAGRRKTVPRPRQKGAKQR